MSLKRRNDGRDPYSSPFWGFPTIRGTFLGGPYKKDHSILGSILGSPYSANDPQNPFPHS